MKKALSILLVLGLLLGLGSAALAEGPQKNSVAELYSAEGSYRDSVGNQESYSFHVPQLTADTPAAAEINAEIAKVFGGYVEEQLTSMAGGYSLWCWNVEWHAYWYGSQLFLTLEASIEGGFTDRAAYGYDFEKGCRVSNEMILEELGISKEDYLANLREKVGLMFEDMYGSIPGHDRTSFDYYGLLNKTLNWQDMEAPMYIDGSGQIVTIAKIASVAGAEWYYHLVTPYAYG